MNNTSGFTVLSFMIMKTFLFFIFFTLCLITGHMGDAEFSVTGITGGSIIIDCVYREKTRESAKSFCKVSGSECTTMTEVKKDIWIPEERFSMTEDESLRYISVLIRNLTVTDSGTYRCQTGRETVQTVDLNVKQESCCGRSEDQTAYLGKTAVIHCKYPDTYKDHGKILFKVQNGTLVYIIHTFGNSATNGRFSLNVNEQEHVFSVTIADVERSDAGVYFCGIDNNKVINPLFTEIQLHVSVSVGRAAGWLVWLGIAVACVTFIVIIVIVLYKIQKNRINCRSAIHDYENEPRTDPSEATYTSLELNTRSSDLYNTRTTFHPRPAVHQSDSSEYENLSI